MTGICSTAKRGPRAHCPLPSKNTSGNGGAHHVFLHPLSSNFEHIQTQTAYSRLIPDAPRLQDSRGTYFRNRPVRLCKGATSKILYEAWCLPCLVAVAGRSYSLYKFHGIATLLPFFFLLARFSFASHLPTSSPSPVALHLSVVVCPERPSRLYWTRWPAACATPIT